MSTEIKNSLFVFQEKAQLQRDEIIYMDHGSPQDMQAQVITHLTPPSDKKTHVPNTPDTPSQNAASYSW